MGVHSHLRLRLWLEALQLGVLLQQVPHVQVDVPPAHVVHKELRAGQAGGQAM